MSRSIKKIILIFVMIVGILIALVIIPKFTEPHYESRTLAKTQISTFGTALFAFEVDNGFFPSTRQGLRVLLDCSNMTPPPTNWHGPYLPRGNVPKDPWGNEYIYYGPPRHPGPHLNYAIISAGGDGKFGTEDDIADWNVSKD